MAAVTTVAERATLSRHISSSLKDVLVLCPSALLFARYRLLLLRCLPLRRLLLCSSLLLRLLLRLLLQSLLRVPLNRLMLLGEQSGQRTRAVFSWLRYGQLVPRAFSLTTGGNLALGLSLNGLLRVPRTVSTMVALSSLRHRARVSTVRYVVLYWCRDRYDRLILSLL